MRVFIISDVHMDFSENKKWLQQLSETEYRQDTLILAGDVAHNLDLLQTSLLAIKAKFSRLFFVPGNHDLWVHNSDWPNSIEKFKALMNWGTDHDILSQPLKLGESDEHPIWIVPLFSWYTEPEFGSDTLYMHKPGEDENNRMWSDNYYIRWPQEEKGFQAMNYFAGINQPNVIQKYDAEIISFSHFLPRQEMMFGDSLKPNPQAARKYDRNPQFNFSRVAGSEHIDLQLRHLGAKMHIYGHQHINRDRVLDGVRYIAHCLGYPKERARGMLKGIEDGLKLVWDTDVGAIKGA